MGHLGLTSSWLAGSSMGNIWALQACLISSFTPFGCVVNHHVHVSHLVGHLLGYLVNHLVGHLVIYTRISNDV